MYSVSNPNPLLNMIKPPINITKPLLILQQLGWLLKHNMTNPGVGQTCFKHHMVVEMVPSPFRVLTWAFLKDPSTKATGNQIKFNPRVSIYQKLEATLSPF